MIGNSIAGRISAFIKKYEIDPDLQAREGVVYKCVLSDQGANINHIINAVTADEWVMRNAIVYGRRPKP